MLPNEHLRELNFSSNDLENDCLTTLRPLCNRLRVLSLENNNLSDDCSESLCGLFCGPLLKLNLSGNSLAGSQSMERMIGDRIALCGLNNLQLSKLPLLESLSLDAFECLGLHLKVLNLSKSGVGNAALSRLADALAANKCRLTSLNLSGNKFDRDGLEALCSVMETQKTVKILNLGRNSFKQNAGPIGAMLKVKKYIYYI
jgi:Ran GTPase-activating protein (RanGAP) involved in mRNA processing and transport